MRSTINSGNTSYWDHSIYNKSYFRRAELAQSVQWLAMSRLIGVRGGGGWEFFLCPSLPDWLWGPLNGYRGFFPPGWSDRTVNLITHLLIVPRSRISGAIPPPPISFHGMVLSWNKGTTLPLNFTLFSNKIEVTNKQECKSIFQYILQMLSLRFFIPHWHWC